MRSLKYANNVDNSTNFVEMYLYDSIGYNPKNGTGIDGRAFAHELRYLTEFHEPAPKEVKVRINSVGGSVMDGFSIFSAIYNANQKGDIVVNTYIDGVAASIAGVIAMAGKNVYMKDYARLMLHGVSMVDHDGKEVAVNENDKAAMSAFTDMIKTVFKNKTGAPESQIEDLLKNGKDNWFNASEAAAAGFLLSSNIENTGLEIDLPVNPDAKIIANRAQKIINTNNYKPLTMKTVINLLNLQEGASETVVANAVKTALENAANAQEALRLVQNSVTEKDAKITDLEGQVKEAQNSAATSFVENQIKEGKFTPKDEVAKAALIQNYVANPEGFKAMAGMIPTKAANVMSSTKSEEEGVKTLLDQINNRGLRQLEKEDPALLSKIKNEAKPEFVKLWNAEYKTNKTEADFK